jgi:DNA helicase-2/ATP-dependent DNA helicase PcrA
LYNETTPEINVGDTIIHTMFGEGLVISQNENIIDVIFKSPYGTKTLNSKHKSVKRKF